MKVYQYLEQYGCNTERLLDWIRQSGFNIMQAAMVIKGFANKNKKFENNYEMNNAIIKELKEKQMELLYERFPEFATRTRKPSLQKSTWERFKKLILKGEFR